MGLSAVPTAMRTPRTNRPAVIPRLACSNLTVVPGSMVSVTPLATVKPGRLTRMSPDQVSSLVKVPLFTIGAVTWGVGVSGGVGLGCALGVGLDVGVGACIGVGAVVGVGTGLSVGFGEAGGAVQAPSKITPIASGSNDSLSLICPLASLVTPASISQSKFPFNAFQWHTTLYCYN